MSYFVYSSIAKIGEEITIEDEEARHIAKSRRHIVGDKIEIQDSSNLRYLVEVCSVSLIPKAVVKAKVLREIKMSTESKLNTVLCQALVKEKALDNILQKATELGVSKIFIFNSDHTPDKLPQEIPGKLARWRKILVEAAKQCGRTETPGVVWCDKFDDATNQASDTNIKIALEQGAVKTLAKVLTAISPIPRIVFFVGPEGGWSEKELLKFKSLSYGLYSMGPRTMRADTSAIAALTITQAILGDLH